MKDIKKVFAVNLNRYRKQAGLTQAELAEKLNYSDKTISKWERAESIPDVTVLTAVAAEFGISLDDLLKDGESAKPEKFVADSTDKKRKILGRNITEITITGIWLVALIFFMVIKFTLGSNWWIIFAWSVPISLLVAIIFNSVWGTDRLKKNFILVSCFVCSIIIGLFFTFLSIGHNLWLIILTCIPAEMIICFAFRMYKNLHAKKSVE
ncbi:MAG: helix-turn-helix domain-containing protein [Clostridia bacterium]|nr:helix-turn-helix domain-containing protein [Clostridia bacterium]